MDKKRFRPLSKKVLLEYGFSQTGKSFNLQMDDITLVVSYAYCRGERCLEYNFSLHALHDLSMPLKDALDERCDCLTEIINLYPDLEGYLAFHIEYDETSEEEYRLLLLSALHTYFDPFKEDPIAHISKKCSYALHPKVREYLKLD